ncbi:MAG: HigA family addiction module antidote protein [Clostridia bacterium]|nr:HigA family addiction module antidote protein [Clostridia bacterium]
MLENMNGLSLDLIIHPGETIKEFLEEKNMKQEELAIRTGFSPKHVSEVVNGKKGISPSFAKSLEYVFGAPMTFWINLQGIYDKEILEYEEQQNIDENEVTIVKSLKTVLKYAEELEIVKKSKNVIEQLIELRGLCNVNKLTFIKDLFFNQVAFRKSQAVDTDIYTLYVWLRICEICAQRNEIQDEYNAEKLKEKIPQIKKCMMLEKEEAMQKLKQIFAECGISFQVVKNVKGAPVQGFIKKEGEKIILTMTTRRKYADEFWFTLFHEIGHLLNGDIGNTQYIDYEDTESNMEEEANKFATQTLINEDDYRRFINSLNINEETIKKFAKSQNVAPFIVVGRMQKETNNYKLYHEMKVRYEW